MRMNFCIAAAKLNEWSFREMENYGKVSLQPHKDPKVLLKLGLSGKLLQSERNGMMKRAGRWRENELGLTWVVVHGECDAGWGVVMASWVHGFLSLIVSRLVEII